MTRRQKRISSKVFDAASAPLRLRILRLLYTTGPLSYSEIMSQLNLDASRDAGKFAYHLRNILQTGLIDVDKETKKYKLTTLGRMIIDFSQSLEEYALKEYGKLLVRTSRLAIEDFDRNKIAQALIREAGVPIELAQRIAEEAEERLLKLDTIYLTAPLVREFVNAILIEKGLQEYRHKLTRLGLPVYDVTQLINTAGKASLNVEAVHKMAGDNIMKEYMLLNALPREIADAHLSGNLHVNNAGCWILKPNEFQHDLRVFLKRGFISRPLGFAATALQPPKTLEAALIMSSAIFEATKVELTSEQAIPYFNLFLAPFVRDLSIKNIEKALRYFIFSLNQTLTSGSFQTRVTLGCEFSVPSHLKEADAIGPRGEHIGYYGEYTDEALRVLEALLNVMFEDDVHKPVFNPHILLYIRQETFKDKTIEPVLLKAHELTAKRGIPYFVNSTHKRQTNVSYFATGTRLDADWSRDWELDTIRTGNLDSVIINLPRIAYEARGNDNKFFETLDKGLSMAKNALEIKYHTMKERVQQKLLPFLSQPTADEPYFRLENATCLTSFVGLSEAVKTHTNHQIHEDKSAITFATKVVEHISTQAKSASVSLGIRMAASQTPCDEAAQRLAELDVEKYGWGVVSVQGTKNSHYYTDLVIVPLETEISLKERLQIESMFHLLTTGGHLTIINLEEPEQSSEKLLNTTKQICGSYDIGAFTYTRDLSYCINCHKVFGGFQQKCPKCKSVSNIVQYGRLSAKYLPLKWWFSSKQAMVNRRFHYVLT